MSGTVRRDGWGVAHLWGDSPDELAHVQGRVTAHDRAWQLEVERWRGEGRLAEHLGHLDGLAEGAVEWDLFARRARLDDTARQAFWRLDPATRRWLRAYVAGVNAGLSAGADRAVEFGTADVRPGRWLPWTPLAVFLVHHVLFGSFPHQLWRDHVVAVLGEQGLDALRFEGAGVAPSAAGSNACALSGTRTATGRPLLAADPHRLLEAPGVYQQVRLSCPDFDVAGLTFPGVPGVQHFGHTGTAAWVVTNAMATSERLHRVLLRREGDRLVTTDGQEVEHRTELIAVRGRRDLPVDVVRTRWGPVVLGDLPGPGDPPTEVLCLQAPAQALGDLGLEALPALMRARTAADVERAFQAWVTPVNSVLAADADGNVRRFVAGRVPAGTDEERQALDADVVRWAPPDQEATAADVVGIAVAANDRRPDTAALGHVFAPPHRARRIAELLDEWPAVGVEDLVTLQSDTLLAGAEPLLSALATTLARALPSPPLRGEGLSPAAMALCERLLRWDRRMDANSTGAAAFAHWRHCVVRRLAGELALGVPAAPSLFAPWLDPVARVGDGLEALFGGGAPRLGVDLAAVIRDGVEEAASRPAPAVAEGRRGTWGDVHRLALVHVLGPYGPALPAPPLGGDGECVLATGSVPGLTDRCVRGPAARVLWDLSGTNGPFGDSRWVVPLGTDGRWDAPHALDQLPLWLQGRLLPVGGDAAMLSVAQEVAVTVASAVVSPRPDGADIVHEAPGEHLGAVRLRRLDPLADAERVHGWVTRDRTRFWGMREAAAEDVREVYAELDALDTHDAFMIEVGGRPCGVLQTYRAEHDPLSEHHPCAPGDFGLHLLLEPDAALTGRERLGFTRVVTGVLAQFLLSRPGTRRVLAEPDADNHRAIALLARHGFRTVEELRLPHKTALLMALVP